MIDARARGGNRIRCGRFEVKEPENDRPGLSPRAAPSVVVTLVTLPVKLKVTGAASVAVPMRPPSRGVQRWQTLALTAYFIRLFVTTNRA